jgi:hypothetical protein
VDGDSVTNVPEVYAASIFRIKVSRVSVHVHIPEVGLTDPQGEPQV